ncbi:MULTISPECIES: Mov34/MPN/PAD-1 family protein [Sphingomonas]|uniref:Mov34/MPN/PAD-1 family protein n=1 Tax=Sphingomonas molluscorum TaxID=418184 RepID=A0ABU8Q643_9SPHN|nr:Mov34/MPN/PAD-1 family protein [Sphingomonas sp. JUb134]MBM7406377.1 integrative and conjugative element protein (TIGR02256 family) [Sphingomonas sp. JUb134]
MRLFLREEVRRGLHRAVSAAGRLEIGGVLMAEQIAPGSFHVVEFTTDGRTGSSAHFVRSVDNHRAALKDFFQRTASDFGRFNYLGEWHSHPNHQPVPSTEDVFSMESLVSGERDIPFAVLLIVQAGRRTLACTATLFERDGEPRPVAISDVPFTATGE